MRHPTSAAGCGSAALIGLALLFAAKPAAGQGSAAGTEDPNNWPQYHHTYNGW